MFECIVTIFCKQTTKELLLTHLYASCQLGFRSQFIISYVAEITRDNFCGNLCVYNKCDLINVFVTDMFFSGYFNHPISVFS